MKILIIGMGSIGHSIVTKSDMNCQIDVLTTSKIEQVTIKNNFEDNNTINASYTYDDLPTEIKYDFIFMTLPFKYKIIRSQEILEQLQPANLCIVPANQGIISLMDQKFLNHHNLVLFERVPFIARTPKKYEEVTIFGIKDNLHIAIEENSKEVLESIKKLLPSIKEWTLHQNLIDISLIPSNSVTHTANMYVKFQDDNQFGKEFYFYRDWNNQCCQMTINLENEVQRLIKEIEKQDNITIDYYSTFEHFKIEDVTIENLRTNITNNKGLRDIKMLVKDREDLFENRYFEDDCAKSMQFYIDLGEKYGVKMETFELISNWAIDYKRKYNKK